MKGLILILILFLAACTGQVKTENPENGNKNEVAKTTTEVQLNNGNKWKADEATKKNVAAITQLVSDTVYANAAKRKELSMNLQTKIDTLVGQCTMQGAAHDALHVWLEKVLDDMKELKEEDEDYSDAYATLKKDIESFYTSFE